MKNYFTDMKYESVTRLVLSKISVTEICLWIRLSCVNRWPRKWAAINVNYDFLEV